MPHRGLLPLALSLACAPSPVAAQEWPHPGNDPGGTRHSPLAQIDRSNVARLAVAWTFDTGDWSDGSVLPSRSAFEATPLVIEGVLYVPSAFSRLFALDAETGRQLWVFDPKIDRSVPRNLYVSRGVSSWTDGKRRLVFLGDVEGRLWAIDAMSGRPDLGFGEGGRVDLRAGMADGFPDAQYGLTSPAAVCGNVVVAGSLVSDAAPRGPSGDVRGLDARTGRPLWRFHTVPRAGEAGYDTWLTASAVSGKQASHGFAAGSAPRSSLWRSHASDAECAHHVQPSGRRSSPPFSRTRSWTRWAMPSGCSRSPRCCGSTSSTTASF